MKKKFNEAMIKLYLGASDESGIGTIELVLIVVVLIALVILFKDGMTKTLSNFIDKIDGQANELF